MARFVVLRHDSPDGLHWDFMLEIGGALRTWALQDEPAANRRIAARALGDHRVAYLDYEGPVSDDRGTVSQWDGGTFEVVEVKRDLVVARLTGRKLVGRAVLERAADSSGVTSDDWLFRFEPD